MRKVLVTAALAAAAMLAPGLVPEARADHEWLAAGHAFRVGHAHVSFLFGRPALGFGFHQPVYYYRYDRPIQYRGHRCSRYCFREARHFYHHDSCPLVRAHFRAYRVDPRWAFERYAPRYDSVHPGYGYDYRGGDGWRDRDPRYDRRYDRYDRDRRYDRRHDPRHDRDRRYDRDERWRCDDDCDDRRDRRHRGRGRGHRHHRGCDHG